MATQAQSPYGDFTKMMDFTKVDFSDFGKLAEQFKMPGVDGKIFAEAQRKNVEAMQIANRMVFEGVQAITQRQVEFARQVMDETVKGLQSIAAAETPEAKLTKQAEVVKEAYEHGLANWRELSELTAKSNTEAADVISKRVSESFDEVRAAFKKPASATVSSKK